MNKRAQIAALSLTTLLCACDLSPDYHAPAIDTPDAYKAQPSEVAPEYWQNAIPYSRVERGEWWRVFDDEVLNNLEHLATENSPTLAAAYARTTQARAAAGTALAEMLPEIEGTLSPRREKLSAGSPNLPSSQSTKPRTSYQARGILTWEVDLFGRLSGTHKIAELNADAQEALYQSALLSLQADVAQQYFSIRMLDAQRAILNRTIALREDSLRIARKQFELGETSSINQSRAEAEYAVAKADQLDLERQRVTLENALAVLIGEVPSSYELAEIPLSDRDPPIIPAGVPSGLLMRRPDVSAAISQIEAANREIGVGRSAFFPRIVLTAVGGYEARTFDELFRWSNRAWLIGPGSAAVLTQPLFEGGRIFHEIDRFESLRDEAVAAYRQQVLVAFAEVEDGLSALNLLAEQSRQQAIATLAARKAEQLAHTRYEAGDISYDDAIEAERSSLSTQQGYVKVQGARWIQTITLIRALGGSWEQKLPESQTPPTSSSDSQATPVENPDSQTPPTQEGDTHDDTQGEPHDGTQDAPDGGGDNDTDTLQPLSDTGA